MSSETEREEFSINQIDQWAAEEAHSMVLPGLYKLDVRMLGRIIGKALAGRGAEAARPDPAAGVLSIPPCPAPDRAWTVVEAKAIRAYGERCWCAGRSCGDPPQAAEAGEALTRDRLVSALVRAGIVFEETAGRREIAVVEGDSVETHIDALLADLKGDGQGGEKA